MRATARRGLAAIVSLCLVLGVAATPSVRAAGSITALGIDGDPGDWVGQGLQLDFAAPADYVEWGSNGPGHVSVYVQRDLSDVWNINISAAGSDAFEVGTYENAQRFADADHPGLDVGGRGRGCNATTGRFTVTEVEHDTGGLVTSLAVSFEMHCEGGPTAVYGELRLSATSGYRRVGVTPSAMAFDSIGVGQASASQRVTVTSNGTAETTVQGWTLEGADADQFEIAASTCVAGAAMAPATSCSIDVRAIPSAYGARSADLVIDTDTYRDTRAVPLAVTGVAPVSAVAWGTTRTGPSYTWNMGASLARSVSSSATYLHATYTTDRVGGSWVDDNGPYAGVYYLRTSNQGSTWTTAKRLNSSSQHGSRGSVATSGKYVYATWVSTTRWIAYKGSSARVLYLRRNANHGASSSWGSTQRLTSTTGRVDWPVVAAAGANVYVAYTDSGTGTVKARVSRNNAATWSTITLGSTTLSTTSGRYGIPRIAAAGSTVVVAWLADAAGTVKARVSTDSGVTWSAADTVATAATDMPAVATTGSRTAVAWTEGATARVRTWDGSTWSDAADVGMPTGKAYTTSYGPALALQGTDGIAVAWSGCVTACSSFTASTRVDLVWSESATDGGTWFAGQILGSASATSSRRYHDYPSVIWPSATLRHVLWNAGTAGTTSYRIVLRTGSGAVAPAAAAAVVPADPGTGDTSLDAGRWTGGGRRSTD